MSDEYTSMLVTWGMVYSTMKVIDQKAALIFVAAVRKWVVKQNNRSVVGEALEGHFIIACTMIRVEYYKILMKSLIKQENL